MIRGSNGFDYLIVAGGLCPPLPFVKKLIPQAAALVTVDRGAEVAQRLKIKPLLHVGDDDSLSSRTLKSLRAHSVIKLPSRKTISDLEYALRGLPTKASKLVVASHRDHEGRTDHLFVNLLLVNQIKNTIFADEKTWITNVASGRLRFSVPPQTVFTVVPLSSKAVTIEGARYSVTQKKFPSPSFGLSNVAVKKWVSVKTKGPALVFVSASLLKSRVSISP